MTAREKWNELRNQYNMLTAKISEINKRKNDTINQMRAEAFKTCKEEEIFKDYKFICENTSLVIYSMNMAKIGVGKDIRDLLFVGYHDHLILPVKLPSYTEDIEIKIMICDDILRISFDNISHLQSFIKYFDISISI